MNFMKKRTTSRTLTQIMCLTAGCGLAMSGSMALAQYDQPADHMEYEPGEGLHEEEWYDPTDWWDDDFDGVRGPDTDYETDFDYGWDVDDDWDDEDYYAVYDGDPYHWSWWDRSYSELYNDGYYDGYYDGFADDEFGYDHYRVSVGTRDGYQSGYAAGYYDGFYDQMSDYEADWTYYLYPSPIDQTRAQASRERSGDDTRERGDRSQEAGTGDMNRRQASEDAKMRESQRHRGTVTRVERLKESRLSSEMKGHRVVRLTFEEGNERVVADLGKKADWNLIQEGDRVSIAGQPVTHDGRKMLDVSRLTVNEKVMWNARNEEKPRQMSSR